MIAAVYCRVSSSEQAESGYSLGDQRDQCTARAVALGASDVRVYEDAGISGATRDRPGLNQLMEDLRTRAIDLVVILDPDRLSRNLADLLILNDEIERLAKLEFLHIPNDDTHEGRLFFAMRGAFAEYEREKIRERTLSGRIAAAKQGKIVCRGSWYGYAFNRETKEYSLDPQTAPVVQMIFRLLVDEKLSPTGIARQLAEAGIPAPRGQTWYPSTVDRILRSPAYAGVVYNFREGHRRGNGWDDLEHAEGVFPAKIVPIVDRALWEEAQQIRGAMVRQLRTGARRPYILAGLVRCGKCGRSMSPSSTTDRRSGKEYHYYECSAASRCGFGPNVADPCRSRARAEAIEDAVWTAVLDILNHPQRVLEALVERQDRDRSEADLVRIREQISFWQAKKNRTLEVYTSGWMDRNAADTAIATCRKHIHSLEVEAEAIENRVHAERAALQRVDDVEAYCHRMLEAVDSASAGDKRRIIAALIERIEWLDGQVTIVGRFDAGALDGAAKVPFRTRTAI